MPQTPENPDTPETRPPSESPPAAPVKVGRDLFLGHSGKRREDTVEIPGLGGVLVREISGRERAKVIQSQAAAARTGTPDVEQYQRLLLLYGLADPDSPEGARRPLLEKADLDTAMELGAAAIDALTNRIEELSGLAVDAEALAAANFPSIPSDASTSA